MQQKRGPPKTVTGVYGEFERYRYHPNHWSDGLSAVSGWQLHDLRRTCASGMARLGTAPHVVEKVLNHASGAISGVAAIYNRHGYLEEKRTALNTWARAVEAIIRPTEGNVVPMHAGDTS